MQKLYGIRDLIGGPAPILPVSKATLYRMIAAGTFPKQRKLGHRSVWAEGEISLWQEQWLVGEK